MITYIKDQEIHYTSHGKGLPLFIIHGFYLDSITMERAIEESGVKVEGFRRIYIDLPGMGLSPRHNLFNNSDIMLDLVCEFIRELIDDHPFIVLGYSYGGYLAQGVAKRFREQIIGEALICPVVIPETEKRSPALVFNREIDIEFFETLPKDKQVDLLEEMVVINRRTYERSEADFSRAVALADNEFLTELYKFNYASMYIESDQEPHEHRALIILGYQDSVVGYQDMLDRLDNYPNATVTLLTKASHSFFLEHPIQFTQTLNSWLALYK